MRERAALWNCDSLGDSAWTQPPRLRTCCEDRRLAIRSLAGRLLQPLDAPLWAEAVRFMAAETNEERKMIVHRLEGAIRREREVAFEQAAVSDVSWDEVFRELTRNRRPIKFRESSWDLNRIYYYLLVQYFGSAALRWEPAEARAKSFAVAPATTVPLPMPHDWLCAARDVEMELERYRAKSKGGSLMPLTYALVALQEIDRQKAPNPDQARIAAQSALKQVQTELGDEVLSSDAGRAIRRVLLEMLPPNELGAWASVTVSDAQHGTAPAFARMPR